MLHGVGSAKRAHPANDRNHGHLRGGEPHVYLFSSVSDALQEGRKDAANFPKYVLAITRPAPRRVDVVLVVGRELGRTIETVAERFVERLHCPPDRCGSVCAFRDRRQTK